MLGSLFNKPIPTLAWSKLVPPKARVLIIGMGGGCDVYSAYALHKTMKTHLPDITAIYGNCVGTRDFSSHELLTKHLYSPGMFARLEDETGASTYKTTLIERSIPRSDTDVVLHRGENEQEVKGCTGPLIFEVPGYKGVVEEVTKTNCQALHGAWSWLQVDYIVGVDNGGDSVTFGVDFKEGKPELGRDFQVLKALQTSGIPFCHVVMGPCCDGESTQEKMRECVGKGPCQAVWQLGDELEEMKRVYGNLGPTRTPRIMCDAWEKVKTGHCQESEEVEIPRNLKPRIPLEWLYHGLVFVYN